MNLIEVEEQVKKAIEIITLIFTMRSKNKKFSVDFKVLPFNFKSSVTSWFIEVTMENENEKKITRVYFLKNVKNLFFFKNNENSFVVLCQNKKVENLQNVEFLSLNELQHNIFVNEKMLEVSILNEKEIEELKEFYTLSDSFAELPKILIDDPIVKFLGLKSGDFVRTLRKRPEQPGKGSTYSFIRRVK